ncbi:MAG: hypothetical protein Q9195_001558 [Heterodermia aff. obscurata]
MIEAKRPRGGPAGSPSSSEAANSAQNTPETKLTAFSPEELRSGYKAAKNGIVRPNVPPTFALNVFPKASPSGKASNIPAALGSGDPFVSSSAGLNTGRRLIDGPKLSPIASSFIPRGAQQGLYGNGNRQNFGVPASTSSMSVGTSGTGFHGTPPRINIFSGKQGAYDSRTAASASGTPHRSQTSVAGSPRKFVKIGQFSSDVNTSRYLFIGHISTKTSMAELDQFFHRDWFPTLKNLGTNELLLTGSIYVSFGDIRESIQAYAKVKDMRPTWSIDFIATPKYFTKQNMATPGIVFEAQLLISADYGGPVEKFCTTGIGIVIKELLENFGEVMAMALVQDASPLASYRVEFYNVGTAGPVLKNLQGFKIATCTLSVQGFPGGNGAFYPQSSDIQRPFIVDSDDTSLGHGLDALTLSGPSTPYGQGNLNLPGMQGGYGQEMMSTTPFTPYPVAPMSAGRSFAFHRDLSGQQMPAPLNLQKTNYHGPDPGDVSPFSPSFSPYHDYGVPSAVWASYPPGAIGQERAAPMLPPYRSSYYPYQQRLHHKYMARHAEFAPGIHNVVDIERIRQGLDVRTTIMLRNIPNKIDQAMLKDIVDETSRGKYDFMYLRIDFANNCNVGYAFINFEDPFYIIDFMNARAGSRWNRFNSDKIAEVSYATIQGRDCLVQKFRNSSVMLEHPSFRPKIFHTTGPMAGTEDIFPGPDNPSKMRRSVENAEHVGLFAPRAGQNFRDEQRRRRSQFDRGTRLAEMEDAYDDRHDYHGELTPSYRGIPLKYRQSSPYTLGSDEM